MNQVAPEAEELTAFRYNSIYCWRGTTIIRSPATMASDGGLGPRRRRRLGPPAAEPYVLRSLFEDVPLATEDSSDVYITCVEYWEQNLYIGTSAAEILHFVCLPAASDDSADPTFILASRLPIPFQSTPETGPKGVQQIVILASVNKACILCNGTVTFYMLPELSPAFGNTKVNHCRWIGGLDLDRTPESEDKPVVMIAAQNRLMLVQIGDEARRIKNIAFPGCLVAARRGTIACAADSLSYSLLEEMWKTSHQPPKLLLNDHPHRPIQVLLLRSPKPMEEARASMPLWGCCSLNHKRKQLPLIDLLPPLEHQTPSHPPGTPRRSSSEDREGNKPPEKDSENSERTENEEAQPAPDSLKPLPPIPKVVSNPLQPHIVSPTPSEFLLVTGTEETEPGVGMFVDTDGEVVHGTINFSRYPKSVVVDAGKDDQALQPNNASREEFIIALIKEADNSTALEIQRWYDDPAEIEQHKKRIAIPSPEGASAQVGLRHTVSPSQIDLQDIGNLLQMVRLKSPLLSPHASSSDPRTQASIEQLQKEKELFESQELSDADNTKKERDWESQRNAEEAKFAQGLGKLQSSLVLWSGSQIWRIVKNPLVVQLENALEKAQSKSDGRHIILQRDFVMDLMVSIQDLEPKNESEFIGLGYLKQKASLLLYGDLLSMRPEHTSDAAINNTEKALLAASRGTKQRVFWAAAHGPVLSMLRRFLSSWQQKRGYGSITDENYVFDSIDAALLHLLLEQDSHLTAQQRAHSHTSNDLNLLVDTWKGNFERAVMLLEQYKRLYVLSRLYQSRKMYGNVLKTWRRIIDGELDVGGEVTAHSIEKKMREYLIKIKDAQLVEDYGSWLAARNPSLGIQVFADNASRVKFDPADVVSLLKERAPTAVQVYLEHLVFAKHYTQYADDLISYYLDEVISVLETSPEARASLSESYSTYRALRPPKPTYLNFIVENKPEEAWWQSRLRLLQLLSGTSGTQFSSDSLSAGITYSIPKVLKRIEPFQDDLVSESIILDGLQGRHRAALRLLTHGLGDYDSAIRYCLFGGPRSPTSSTKAEPELADYALQSELFRDLLDEFLHIKDLSERIERTSDLLARFAAWFDVTEVLELVPEDWSVDILGGFFVHVFRTLVSQTREARIERALSAGLNLRIGVDYTDSMEKAGPWLENGDGVKRLKGGGPRDLQHPPPAVDGDNVEDDGEFGEVVSPSP
ncbi:hypothetical protein N7470_009507 [Penicillium chermesinum]|nr:hypothetical protein N7470_009507 [Penicillium chermesinum]